MSTSPTVVALVPARSGSKRVARKNIRSLAGHPLIAFTIAATREAGFFEDVIVSTDSEEVADVARHYGAEVPFLRPAEYAGDHSPDIEWIEDLLRRLEKAGRTFDCFAILRPTSPFRNAAMLCRAWDEFLRADDVDSLRAVERARLHPGKMWAINGRHMTPLLSGGPKDQPWHSSPYQTLPKVYAQNASLEIAWSRVVFEHGTIAGEVVMPFITEGLEGFDINDREDWWLAEELVRRGRVCPPQVAETAYT